jgi:gamma-glutamyltranspeptidase/glutathione hydrolase
MEIFWAGGNAVDAAVAMASALTVVEPTSNGIGGDAFALVWDGKLHGLNASGKSPPNLTPERFAGQQEIPKRGWLTVTVPGAVSAWYALWKRWGKLPFEQLFVPAIRYAEEGFPVSPVTAQSWQAAAKIYLPRTAVQFQPFQAIFFPQNRAPQAGEIWSSVAHAKTLKEIAASGGESFYRGKLARAIANFAAETGGLLTEEALADHEPEWVAPISTTYRHWQVWEMPPNTQGLAALMALNILEGFDLASHPRDSAESYHRQLEAMKLALADVHRHVADASWMEVSVSQMLDKHYATQRRELIQHQAISLAESGLSSGGTVYLATADGDLMVSFIQSNYQGFGSGLLVPGTGIALHNRACGFNLEAGHPNQVGPGKRPFHTIIPGFLSQDGQPLGPFGVMGGAMQPQGHLQVVVNLADYGMNLQAALDAPRWRFCLGNRVLLEFGVSENVVRELRERGHQIEMGDETMFGKGQIILRQGGTLVAGSEPRGDGLALAQ